MDYDRRSNGWITFLEHYWFFVIAITALIGSQALNFIARVTGTPWICCYAVALLVSVIGVGMIFYAKLPLYQLRRFFTFGSAAIPESREVVSYKCTRANPRPDGVGRILRNPVTMVLYRKIYGP